MGNSPRDTTKKGGDKSPLQQSNAELPKPLGKQAFHQCLTSFFDLGGIWHELCISLLLVALLRQQQDRLLT